MHMLTLRTENRFAVLIWLMTAVAILAMPLPTHAADDETTALRKRVEQLEEQIVDMQVVIGTLQSLGGRAASAQPAASAGDYSRNGGGTSPQVDTRLRGLETQIRALTAQLERLQKSQATGVTGQNYQGYGDNYSTELARTPERAPKPRGFGSTTVTQPVGTDPIGGYIDDQLLDDKYGDAPQGQRPAAGQPPRQNKKRYAATNPPKVAREREVLGGNPKALYETAYGYLLQQDYGAAEVAFLDFLQRYPKDDLAGNAQYWLGESHYVRGQYKSAAGAFLKGYQTYARSSKAPDSLLKLAMSLDRLGQKDAACSSYSELISRFPKAPAHVKNRAASERRRVGC